MSDDSEWRYSIEEAENIQKDETNTLLLLLGVISIAAFILLLIIAVISPTTASPPSVTVTEIDNGSEVTVGTFSAQYLNVTVKSKNSTTTVRKTQTIQVNSKPENLTITRSKFILNNRYPRAVETEDVTIQTE